MRKRMMMRVREKAMGKHMQKMRRRAVVSVVEGKVAISLFPESIPCCHWQLEHGVYRVQ